MIKALILFITSHLTRGTFLTFLILQASLAFSQNPYDQMPFSTNASDFTIWNGDQYVSLFLKGVNLGVSKPGTQPGELAASKSDYVRWFALIQKAGFNTVRLYTLHYPQFYEALDSFNRANPNRPIYFFQGIWIEEEIAGYSDDLYTLTAPFVEEMRGNIRAVHGDATILAQPGKAYGNYTFDVSQYLLGFIVGREIHPPEVWTTNSLHNDAEFNGNYLRIADASPSEVWMTDLLDRVLSFEKETYDMFHPISFSSWPTLDPLHHAGEPNRYEDSVTIDLTKMDLSGAPAGYFASYHAYPYYPDFISQQADYLNAADYEGQNSYLGYLRDLKDHYSNVPLVIAEFGTSSSWGIAHYAHNSIHHGGATEIQQGEAYLRMFRNLREAGVAGGIQFSWIDEWFKRTWITDPLDNNADRRVLWQNITSAEQNFGLLGYKKKGTVLEPWESICTPCDMEAIEAGADYSFFRLKLKLGSELTPEDTLWLGIDTYSDQHGESILPNGDTIDHRAEFSLMLTQDQAVLFVTEAYDLYGIWHGTSTSKQLYRSVATDGAPWQVVKWKNNNTTNEVQYIGRLGVNRLNLPLKSTDAVIIKNESIEIRLPWTLLQFVDPSEKKVMHDYRNTSQREDSTSTGIAVDLILRNQKYSTLSRYGWDNWQFPSDVEEYAKESYHIIANELENIPSAPIAHADQYTLTMESGDVSSAQGVLKNDIYFSTSSPQVYLVESASNGIVQLNPDGSFHYQPIENFNGSDRFTYILKAGPNWSEPVSVSLDVESPLGTLEDLNEIVIYPNPSSDYVNFNSKEMIRNVEIFNTSGQLLLSAVVNNHEEQLDVQRFTKGIYFIRFDTKTRQVVYKFLKN